MDLEQSINQSINQVRLDQAEALSWYVLGSSGAVDLTRRNLWPPPTRSCPPLAGFAPGGPSGAHPPGVTVLSAANGPPLRGLVSPRGSEARSFVVSVSPRVPGIGGGLLWWSVWLTSGRSEEPPLHSRFVTPFTCAPELVSFHLVHAPQLFQRHTRRVAPHSSWSQHLRIAFRPIPRLAARAPHDCSTPALALARKP